MTHLANPSWCSEETRIVQALRLRLRRLHQELNEARELQYMAERHTEEHRMQCEALDDMRRHHVQEVQRLDRQSRIEQRHQASLRAQLAEEQRLNTIAAIVEPRCRKQLAKSNPLKRYPWRPMKRYNISLPKPKLSFCSCKVAAKSCVSSCARFRPSHRPKCRSLPGAAPVGQ
eukprot:g8950.t1